MRNKKKYWKNEKFYIKNLKKLIRRSNKVIDNMIDKSKFTMSEYSALSKSLTDIQNLILLIYLEYLLENEKLNCDEIKVKNKLRDSVNSIRKDVLDDLYVQGFSHLRYIVDPIKEIYYIIYILLEMESKDLKFNNDLWLDLIYEVEVIKHYIKYIANDKE